MGTSSGEEYWRALGAFSAAQQQAGVVMTEETPEKDDLKWDGRVGIAERCDDGTAQWNRLEETAPKGLRSSRTFHIDCLSYPRKLRSI